MKNLLSLLAVLLIAATGASAQNAAPTPAPKIVCDKPEFDFGQAEPNSVVNHDYIVRNAGEATLLLNNVRASCGCTVAKTSTNTLKPGETATITASLNLAGRNGPQTKHVIVESNDPSTPTMILTLRGGIRQDFDIQPPQLSPGAIRGDVSVAWELTFQNNTPGPVHVKSATAATNSVLVDVTTIETGKTYRIHVKTVPPLVAGNISTTIRIETDHPARPVHEVPFGASIMGSLTVAPQSLIVAGPSATPVTRYIIIRPGSAQQFKVLSIEPPVPGITTQTTPFGSTGVRITLNNIVPTAELNGKSVKITTDVPSMPEILVPFSVVQQQ